MTDAAAAPNGCRLANRATGSPASSAEPPRRAQKGGHKPSLLFFLRPERFRLPPPLVPPIQGGPGPSR